MLLDPRAPFIFGCVMILLLGAYLTRYHPVPGELAAPHSRVEGLSMLTGCKQCHAEPVEGGLARGCLGCHEEIAAQLSSGSGYHDYLLRGKSLECARCHTEHAGRSFELVNRISWEGLGPDLFGHPHVEYRLLGKHAGLSCEECHVKKTPGLFALPRFAAMSRPDTFLGLSQQCIACHEDVHSGGLSPACETCHGQEAFRPASLFDHAKYFPLDGGHDRVSCASCHVIPAPGAPGAVEAATASPARLPFDKVRGKACEECHPSPHRAPLGKDCDRCHPRSAPQWAEGSEGVTAGVHAATGFRLAAPHDAVACEKCHPVKLPFGEKYPDASSPGYARREETCEGCHADVHAGQFLAKHSRCLDCHEAVRFKPARFGLAEHGAAYSLDGAHAAVPCSSCHKPRAGSTVTAFAGTERECKACHAEPHGGQFAAELATGDCTACHEARAVTFAIRPYDHAKRTGYALTGAHVKADCAACHRAAGATPAIVAAPAAAISAIYRNTPKECSSCHRDVHRGQFREGGRVACDRCHVSTTVWKTIQFDHDRQSRFALDKTHAKVPCAGCHPTVRLPGPDGGALVQYKPLGTKCEDCHAFKVR